MFPPNSHFSYNPHLRAPRAPKPSDATRRAKPHQYPTPVSVPARVFGDWMHRLREAADEAGDENLLALESDLIDLQDEMSRYS